MCVVSEPALALSMSSPREIPIILFFFFQAEDGIRDSSVTGVQTCALPILVGVLVSERSVVVILDGTSRQSASVPGKLLCDLANLIRSRSNLHRYKSSKW